MYPGHVLKNSYRFEKLIGSGGMGEVWLAKRLSLQDFVAIKVLKLSSFNNSEEMAIQLFKEAKATSALNHPNICKVYDFINEKDQCFLIMEFLDGIDLDKIIELGVLNTANRVKFALYVVKQVLRALDHAHNIQHNDLVRILHRDIKPANIFLTKNGEVKLLDLGIAKTESSGSNTTHTKAYYTLRYSSPDLWINGVYNPTLYNQSHDLYSLGLVFYEIITGKKAVKANSAFLAEREQHGDKLSLKDYIDEDSICLLFAKWISFDQSNRFQTSKELIQIISEFEKKFYTNEQIIIDTLLNISSNIVSDQTVFETTAPVKKKRAPQWYLTYMGASFLTTLILVGLFFYISPIKLPKKTLEIQRSDSISATPDKTSDTEFTSLLPPTSEDSFPYFTVIKEGKFKSIILKKELPSLAKFEINGMEISLGKTNSPPKWMCPPENERLRYFGANVKRTYSEGDFYLPRDTKICVSHLAPETITKDTIISYIANHKIYGYHITLKKYSKDFLSQLKQIESTGEWRKIDCADAPDEYCYIYENRYEEIKIRKHETYFGDYEIQYNYILSAKN